MRELAQIFYDAGIEKWYFERIFQYKHDRFPTKEERQDFEAEYEKIEEENSSYEDDDSYSY